MSPAMAPPVVNILCTNMRRHGAGCLQLFNNAGRRYTDNAPVSAPGEGLTVGGGSSENCPSCGAPLAVDQRYCLECGHRRGDPRLPFMDAVVFMEAINQPQTPATPASPDGNKPRGGISANASLIAGIATLVLAIGVGVLIGQSGDNGTSSAANQAPQIIRVGGSGGEEEATASTEGEGGKKDAGAKEKGKSKNPNAKKAEKKAETGSTGQTKATEEVLEPKVPQAKPEASVGETCDKGTAGCSDNGKFEGNFFGE